MLLRLLLWSLLLAPIDGYEFGHQTQYTIDLLENSLDQDSNKVIKMGTSASMDSETRYAGPGAEMVRAWDFFLDWVNLIRGGIDYNGGMNYVAMELIEDNSNISDVAIAYEALVESHGILFGPFSSPLTEEAIKLADQAGRLMIASAASNTSLFAGRARSFGALPPSYKYLDSSMAVFGLHGAKSVAVLGDKDSGCGDYNDSKIAAEKYNMTLFGFFQLDPLSASYSADVLDLAERFKLEGVEAIVGCTFAPLCYEIVNSFKAIDYNPFSVSLSSCLDLVDFLEVAGVEARGFMMPTAWDKSLDIVDNYTGWTPSEFSQRYKDAYGQEPSYLVASSFSSAEVVMAAIEHTQSLDPGVLAKAIKESAFPTIFAKVTFDANHQIESEVLIVQMQKSDSSSVIYPPDAAKASFFKLPSWKVKSCERDTNDCSGRGYCNDNERCICDPGYYGLATKNSCDAYCNGTLAEDVERQEYFCKVNTTFYVGGVVSSSDPASSEIAAMMRLAVELVNNKSDGFFDDLAPQVFFNLTEDTWECSYSGGADGILEMDEEVKAIAGSSETVLAAVIGPACSSASDGASVYGDRNNIPQLSYGSTLIAFSDKNNYAFFTRTCPSDGVQALAVNDLLGSLGLTNIALVSIADDPTSKTMADAFIASFSSNGVILLHESYTYGTGLADADYAAIMDRLAASGAPVIVLLTMNSEAENIFLAAKQHDIMSDNKYVWVGTNDWVNYNVNNVPFGSIGVINYPTLPRQPISAAFLDLWKSLDPVEYPDYDGDRSRVASYAAFAVDAVVAMAMAYQETIDANYVGSESGRRQAAVGQFLNVQFLGVSNQVSFDANRDRASAEYQFVNFQGSVWEPIGSASIAADGHRNLTVDSSAVIWPNNQQGAAGGSAYVKQYEPMCPPGEEPDVANGVYTCDECRVGFYKPDVGNYPCISCPDGTDCNDVGIVVPCVLPGYWRPEPPAGEEGDFSKWEVFRCDMTNRCLGGCQLNATCAMNVKQDSPVCAVCEHGYYDHSESCLQCPVRNTSWKLVEYVLIIMFALIVWLAVFALISFGLNTSLGISVFSVDQPESISVVKRQGSLSASRSKTVSSIINTISYASALVSDLKARGLFVTIKLTVSFFQVLLGALSNLELDWKNSIASIITIVDLNPMHYFPIISGCHSEGGMGKPFVHIILIILLPVGFFFMLGSVRTTVYFLLRRNAPRVLNSRSVAINKAMNDVSLKAIVWFCLFSFPMLASGTITYFDCRDMGEIGSYMRDDYSVRCDGNPTYSGFLVVAVICVLLYPVGIPVFYYVLIRDRDKEWARVGSTPLHSNFLPEWAYFEVFELFRKLLLTSVVAFVMPGTTTQCMYLFCVDLGALLILSNCRPYASDPDDFLSGVLILTECSVFYIASLIVSEVYLEESYDITGLNVTSLTLIFLALVFFIPMNLASKIPSTHRLLESLTQYVSRQASKLGIKVTRVWKLDARSRYEQEVETLRESIVTHEGFQSSNSDRQDLQSGLHRDRSAQNSDSSQETAAFMNPVHEGTNDL